MQLGAIILKQIITTKKTFILCEIHDFDGINHSVKNKLYENTDGKLRQVPLTACEQTAEITPEYTWNNCGRPMIIEYRSSVTNKIDGSNVPVALINDAVNRAKRSEQKAAFDCLLSADGIQNGFHNPAAHTVQYKPQEIFTDIP